MLLCSESSFGHVKAWATSHDLQFAEVRACVGFCAGRRDHRTSDEQEDWLKAAAAWCSKVQFEYLEVRDLSVLNRGIPGN